jgi:hypothetical protein
MQSIEDSLNKKPLRPYIQNKLSLLSSSLLTFGYNLDRFAQVKALIDAIPSTE